MNLVNYANRLYEAGHIPGDFAELKPGLVIVSPIRPPGLTSKGVTRPAESCAVPGQFCLSHKVEAVSNECPDGALALNVGDVVKCREAHLDKIDLSGKLFSLRQEHVIAVVLRADGTSPSQNQGDA